MARTVEKILKIIVDILTGIVLLAILVLLYGKIEMQISGNNYSNYFGYTLFKVTTGSMGNAVKIDDVVIVKIGDEINENDIITYYEDKSFITHRVLRIENSFLVTKGDANNTEDTPIAKTQVIGKVIHTIRGLGIWQKVLSTPQILISIFVTLLLFDFVFSLKNKKEKELEKTRKLELDKIKEMTNTQIIKLDEIINETKKERKITSKKDKNSKKENIEKVEEIIENKELIDNKEIVEEIEVSNDIDENKEEVKEETVTSEDSLDEKSETVDQQEVDKKDEEIELLTTQAIPVDEILKQEIL